MGSDLALVEGATPQIIGRNACRKLWTTDELKQHMLSPKIKQKQGDVARTDFSPTKKELLKSFVDCFLKHFKVPYNHIRCQNKYSKCTDLGRYWQFFKFNFLVPV